MSIPSLVSLFDAERKEVEALARVDGFVYLGRDQLPSFFPAGLRDKFDSAVLICSGTSSGTSYLVCNGLRVDAKAREIDQEPFAVIVTPSGASSSGMLLHHGDWPGRTITPPPEYWEHVLASGIGNYFVPRLPSAQSGALSELGDLSHRAAFETAVRFLMES